MLMRFPILPIAIINCDRIKIVIEVITIENIKNIVNTVRLNVLYVIMFFLPYCEIPVSRKL